VLKTAEPGIEHKSDVDGVRLSLADEHAVAAAWRDVSSRLGPRTLVAPMIQARGVEMLLGAIHDEQFGPVVVLGLGGLHVEALADVVHAVPPFDAAEARRLVDRLKARALLTSRRHARPLALDEFCATAAKFSALVASVGDAITEIDLNPIILHAEGCVIVDALIVGRPARALANNVRRAV
jgi:acetate---CoA ligase (ADP-forming)